jgi:hypothetical protein
MGVENESYFAGARRKRLRNAEANSMAMKMLKERE